MNKKQLIAGLVMGILMVGAISYAEQEVTDDMQRVDKYVLILKSTQNYDEAVRFATEASKKLGLEFNNAYREFSKKKGIYYSKNCPSKLYAGCYYPRRYDGEQITLENSGDYKGFAPAYIIVMAGIYEKVDMAEKALVKVKKFYKDAYVEKTNMWMGVHTLKRIKKN
jgi:hypothetical protein